MTIALRGRPRRVRALPAVAVAVAALFATACEPAVPTPAPPPEGWFQSYVTRDDVDELRLVPTDEGVDVEPEEANGWSNSRTVFGHADVPIGADGTSCGTATQSGWPAQEGVALRIATDTADGVLRTRAVTVTKNIYLMISWIYNVHVWDTSDPERPSLLVASVDLGGAVPDGDSDTVPRRLCARVSGRELEVKLWHPHHDEPDWGDAVHTTAVVLPASQDHPGRPGWYAGHLPTGSSLSLTDLSAESVPK